MAGKINLKTDEAVAEVRVLIEQLKELDSNLSKMSSGSVAGFNKMVTSMTGFSSKIDELNKQVDRLSNITKTNSKRLTTNTREMERNSNLTKTNSKNTRELTRSMDKNVEALKAQTKESNKSANAAVKQSDAYSELVTQTREAQRTAQILTVEQGKGALDTLDAVEAYRRLRDQLQEVNSTVEVTKNRYELLKDETKRLKESAQDMIATYGRESTAAQSAIASWEESAQKLEQTNLQVKKQVSAYQELAQQTEAMKMKAQDLNVEQGKSSAAAEEATKAYRALKKQLDEATIAQEKQEKATKKATKSGNKLAGMFKRLLSSLGIIGFVAAIGKAVQSVIQLTIKFESLGFALNKISGEMFSEIKRSWEFMIDLNDKFGASLLDTTQAWVKFRAAAKQSGLAMTETMDVFRSVTKASAVLGLSTQELSTVYLALEQMLSKGKITTEELRRQLGERLPGAMGIMADAVGVSTNKLDEMMKKGEVLSSWALPRFAKALEEAYGIESLNKVENLSTAVGKMTGAWERFVYTVSEGDSWLNRAIGSTLKLLSDTLNAVTNYLETYEQTANRISGEKFGDKIREELGGEAEDRLKQNQVIKEKIELLEETIRLAEDERKNAESGSDEELAAINKIRDATVELETFRRKQTEEYYKNELDRRMDILAATIDGSEAEKKAIEEVNKADRELTEFRERKAKELNKIARENYLDELKKLEEMGEAIEKIQAKKREADKTPIDRNLLPGETPEQSVPGQLQVGEEAAWGYPGAGVVAIFNELTKEIREATGDISDEQRKINEELDEANDKYTEQLERVKQLGEAYETRTDMSGVDEEEEVYRRRIRLAKEYAETNQQLIRQMKEQMRQNDLLAKNEMGGFEERLRAIEENSDLREMVLDLELEDQMERNEVWLRNENKKLEQNLEQHKDNFAAYSRQLDENKKQEEQNRREKLRRDERAMADYRVLLKQSQEKNIDDIKQFNEDAFSVFQVRLQKELAEEVQAIQRRLDETRKGGNEEKRLLLEMEKVKLKYYNLMIDNEIALLKIEMSRAETEGERLRIAQEIAKLEAQKKDNIKLLPDDPRNPSIVDPLFAAEFERWASKSQEVANQMFGLANAIYEYRIDLIQKEIDAETAKYDRLLELAEGDAEETKIIERNKALALEKLEEKKRKEQIKQAKLDKKLRIMQAVTNTSVAVTAALTTIPTPVGIALAALVGAAGLAEIAAIMATPIPSFAKGGVMDKDGKALINDGGRQEYIQRGNKIMTTGETNAIVELKRGDVIHKDFEELQRKTMLLSLMSGGGSITEKELNLAFGIKEEIKQGFKKAKIESNVVVISNNDDYRRKMSMWD